MQPSITLTHNETHPRAEAAPHPLQSHLTKLAQAQAEIEANQAAASKLTEQPAVSHYLAFVAARKTLKQAQQAAYLALTTAALSEFDGVQKALHPDVTIGIFREAHISRHDVALLWLLCHAADTVNILDTKNMTKSIQSLGKVMPLVLRREHARALVEAIFSRDAFTVSGNVERLDPQTQEPIGVDRIALTIHDCPNSAAACEEAVRQIETDLGPDALWRWAVAPSITPTTVPVKRITFAEATTIPKPHIGSDLPVSNV